MWSAVWCGGASLSELSLPVELGFAVNLVVVAWYKLTVAMDVSHAALAKHAVALRQQAFLHEDMGLNQLDDSLEELSKMLKSARTWLWVSGSGAGVVYLAAWVAPNVVMHGAIVVLGGMLYGFILPGLSARKVWLCIDQTRKATECHEELEGISAKRRDESKTVQKQATARLSADLTNLEKNRDGGAEGGNGGRNH